jgi:hypothetical protein
MVFFRRFAFCLLFPLLCPALLQAQQGGNAAATAGSAPAAGAATGASESEPGSFVGMTLERLLGRFGTPKSVYTSRGAEEWQDDVVFFYDEGEFYVYKDRVWQVRLKSAYRVRVGDPKPAALLALEGDIVDGGIYIINQLPAKGWPLALRLNLDSSGFVSGIFVYRSDF